MEVQKIVDYNGKRYRLSSTNPKYYYTDVYMNGNRNKVGLHQQTYIDNHGPIPENHDIHHIDGNTFNNDPTNLEAILRSVHRSSHQTKRMQNPLYREEALKQLKENNHKAIPWHSSKEGLEFHSINGKNAWIGRKLTKMTCAHCEKEFETAFPLRTSVCSNKCSQNKRYADKKDFAKRGCQNCGKEFECRKNDKSKTCSPKCRFELRSINLKLKSK